ncbi:MAG: 50S ribosomal protein L4 [Methanotrichaceae archaeon]
MKAKVIDLSGKEVSEIELPLVFDEEYRPDLIKKAVLAAQANKLQPYGPSLYSGLKTSAKSWGTCRGASRVPRIVNGRRAARVTQARGGRRAHPPKPEADRTEKINAKERKRAIRSAIAATSNPDLVRARGHIFSGDVPVIVQSELETTETTKEVKKFLMACGLWDDVMRAKNGRTIRAGRGKMRGRKYKQRKSLLIVAAEDNGLMRASKNLPGVDFATVDRLNAELLAPGTHAGRLIVWTESSLNWLGEKYDH